MPLTAGGLQGARDARRKRNLTRDGTPRLSEGQAASPLRRRRAPSSIGFVNRFHSAVVARAVALALGLGAEAGVARAGVDWEPGTLADALGRAKAEKRLVLVDLFASWCGPCHEMDEQVYSRPDVGEALRRPFVALRRDGELGEGREIHARYHVVGFPTLLVLAPDGTEVDRIMGFTAGPELLATLASFRAGTNTLAALEKRAASSRVRGGDPALQIELAKRHALRGDSRAPVEAERVVAGDPENRAGRAAEALFTLGKYYYLRGRKEPASAARTLERLIQVYPASPQAVEAPYQLAIAQHGLGDDARAQKTLDGWLAAGPKDAEKYNGFAWCCFKNGFARARGIAVAREGLSVFPRADALWDSLAELLAQDGHSAEAAAAERKALEIKPADRYYTTQLLRFEGPPGGQRK
ncbi:MAG: DUF255 domain-containing protein [Myxococcales bacterium]|nr:DUF255 domain-containing protein [Myxococcales bacterium]